MRLFVYRVLLCNLAAFDFLFLLTEAVDLEQDHPRHVRAVLGARKHCAGADGARRFRGAQHLSAASAARRDLGYDPRVSVEEGLKLASKPPANYDRMIEMKVSFDTDGERALQDTRHWAALALTPEEKMLVEDPMQMEKLAEALPVERAASRWIVSNDPDEHIEKIRPYVEMGFRHLVFHAPGPDQERFLRLYGEQVLPKLRRRFD